MVQIRDSLPLLTGKDSGDSASLAASLVADQLHPDFKAQLHSQKLITTHDHSHVTDTPDKISESDIDIDKWLSNVAQRIGLYSKRPASSYKYNHPNPITLAQEPM